MLKIFKNNKQHSEKEIFYEHADSMMYLCMRYLKKKEDAEEALQNGFLKVFANLKQFTPEHEYSFRAWIKKIMINECLMMLRQNHKMFTLSIDNEHFDMPAEQSDNCTVEYLFDLLKNLPEGYRTVFNLYVIEGYKHNEIAEMLQISESTSRSQLHKARTMLQNRINSDNSTNVKSWKQTS